MYLAVVCTGALFQMFGKVTFPLKGWKKVTNPTMVKVKRSVKVILITS